MPEPKGIRVGQRVRVTSLQDARGWRGQQLLTVPAGRQCDGIVHDMTSDGFFELHQDSGDVQSFNTNDTSISVVPLSE